MHKTINFYDFQRDFENIRPNNFSHSGVSALWDYLEEYEDSTGEQIEFDLIAICCDYTEYDDLEEFWGNYDKETYPDFDTIREWTELIEVGKDSFIIQNF